MLVTSGSSERRSNLRASNALLRRQMARASALLVFALPRTEIVKLKHWRASRGIFGLDGAPNGDLRYFVMPTDSQRPPS